MLEKVKVEKYLHNPLKLLKKKSIFDLLRVHLENNHLDLRLGDIFVSEYLKFLLVKSGEEMISAREILNFYKKESRKYLRLQESEKNKKIGFIPKIVLGELYQAKTMLDFGCGKLTLVNIIARENKNLEKIFGVDQLSDPDISNIDSRIEFARNTSGIKSDSIDLVVAQFVFHHMANESEIKILLGEIERLLSVNGKLLVFEESFFESNAKHQEDSELTCSVDIATNVNEQFLKLNKDDKSHFIFLVDWLNNLNNDYMPWTLEYRTVEEWESLLTISGFKKRKSFFIGSIVGKRKQGMTSVLIFDK